MENLDAVEEESKIEIVHAKYVIGTDGESFNVPPPPPRSGTDIPPVGAHSWVRNALGIEMEGEQSGNLTGLLPRFCCMSNETEQTTFGVLSIWCPKQTFLIFGT